jgi:hypothetical protein
MRFYIEPEIQEGQQHPKAYRLHVAGSGRFHGLVGTIHDAMLADLIMSLLNAYERRRAMPTAPPAGWKIGDRAPEEDA